MYSQRRNKKSGVLRCPASRAVVHTWNHKLMGSSLYRTDNTRHVSSTQCFVTVLIISEWNVCKSIFYATNELFCNICDVLREKWILVHAQKISPASNPASSSVHACCSVSYQRVKNKKNSLFVIFLTKNYYINQFLLYLCIKQILYALRKLWNSLITTRLL